MMSRVLIILSIMVMLCLAASIAEAINVPCEIMPGDPAVKRITDPGKDQTNAVAGKLWWHRDKKMYRREIILYNETPSSRITQEIYDYVMSLNPTRYTGEENYGYKLWPTKAVNFNFDKFKKQNK
ncbi:MAG: hypothetical protein KQI62_02045 [Deltaproteobacteria bacterium]|nr:hypothetical protein [Deltaproteobacteria bacterium]